MLAYECADMEGRGMHPALILIDHLKEERRKSLKTEIRMLKGGYRALAELAKENARAYQQHIDRIKDRISGT